MNFQEKAEKLKRITTHKECKCEEVCLQTSLEKVSQWHRRIGRKNPRTLNGSRTYGLLVQMLHRWATGDSRELRPPNSVHVPNILHTASTGNVDSKTSIKPPGGLIYFKLIWGGEGLMEKRGIFESEGGIWYRKDDGIRRSVLHNELEYKVEKLKYIKVGGHATEDQNEIWTSSR